MAQVRLFKPDPTVTYELCSIAAVARADRRDDLPAAFAEALGEARPFLLDVRVDPSGYPHVMAATRGGGARA